MAEESRLLALPAELRLQIYLEVLAPTSVLTLHQTTSKRFAVTPAVSPALLRTCKQINHEATQILYTENEIAIAVDAHDTTWSTIPERRLPQRVLEKLRRFCVVLDCTNYFRANYEDVDFGPFVGLSVLRNLRVAMVYRMVETMGVEQPAYGSEERLVEIMMQLLSRVPKTCKVVYGAEKGSQQEALLLNVMRAKSEQSWGGGSWWTAGEMKIKDGADLEAAAGQVPNEDVGILAVPGGDVFAESHAMLEHFK